MKKISIFVLLLSSLVLTLNAQENSMQWLSVKGNKIVNEDGKTMMFHGINVADPDKLAKAEKWEKALFEEVKDWGANIVRLPIHPRAWRERGKEDYLKLLDQAVEWANELELYLIFDWHSIGNLRTELYQHPMYNTTKKETFEFWKIIADRYKEEPAVAFYELFNEPTTANNTHGSLTWAEWKEILIDMIVIVKANNPKAIPLVAGFNWAYDLTPLKNDPIMMDGIAYVSHPYPQKREQPWEPQWQNDFGFIASQAPLMLTEVGFALPEEKGVHIPVYGDETYGKALVEYADKIGAHWVVWVFDPDWSPMMIKDWDFTPTRQGAFFKEVMQND
ncbi:MAG: glycoside hydrolase family 5 protein [Bacteroidota bacterium]